MSPSSAYFLSLPLLLIVQSHVLLPPCFLSNHCSLCPHGNSNFAIEHDDPSSSSPTSSSKFYYPVGQEQHYPQSTAAGAQPNSGHTPARGLSGSVAMETRQQPIGGGGVAPPTGTVSALPAGDGPGVQVAARGDKGESPWEHLSNVGVGGAREELRMGVAKDCDLEVSLL